MKSVVQVSVVAATQPASTQTGIALPVVADFGARVTYNESSTV